MNLHKSFRYRKVEVSKLQDLRERDERPYSSILQKDWDKAKRYMQSLENNGYSVDQYCSVYQPLNDKCCDTREANFKTPDVPFSGM